LTQILWWMEARGAGLLHFEFFDTFDCTVYFEIHGFGFLRFDLLAYFDPMNYVEIIKSPAVKGLHAHSLL